MYSHLISDAWIRITLLSRRTRTRSRKHSKTVGGLSESHYKNKAIHLVLCAILGQLFVSVWNRTGATIIDTFKLLYTTLLQKEKLNISRKQHIHTEISDWYVAYQTDQLWRKGRHTAFRWQQLLLSKYQSTNYQLEHTTCKRHAHYTYPG